MKNEDLIAEIRQEIAGKITTLTPYEAGLVEYAVRRTVERVLKEV